MTTIDVSDGSPPTIKPGQGQWAAGDRTPLNPNEAMKADDDGLNVRERVETIYAAGGFASIPRSDLTGRLRWWGLYTQRRPGIDGGRDRAARARGAGGRVLHDAGALGRRPPVAGPAAHDRNDLDGVRPRHRRRLRPPEHPAPLDPHRGRARDLAPARGRAACRPRRRAATCPASSWAHPSPVSRSTRSSTAPPRSRRS